MAPAVRAADRAVGAVDRAVEVVGEAAAAEVVVEVAEKVKSSDRNLGYLAVDLFAPPSSRTYLASLRLIDGLASLVRRSPLNQVEPSRTRSSNTFPQVLPRVMLFLR